MNRAFITGIGLLTSFGPGKESFWNGLVNKKSGIKEVTLYDTSTYYQKSAGECSYIPEKINRANIFLKKVLDEGLESAKLSIDQIKGKRVKIYIGTAHGDLLEWQDFYKNNIRQSHFPIYNLGETLQNYIKKQFPVEHYSTACTSSTIALGMAKMDLESKLTDMAIVIGIDIASEFIHAGFTSLRALTHSVCKPFDKDRDGLILGEGAACILLESESSLKERNLNHVYGILSGFGSYCDAVHLTAPDRAAFGAIHSIKKALSETNIPLEKIDYINLHGTGTPYNDQMETTALKILFGSKAYELPVNSIKSSIGHTSGASGAIEAALLCLSIQENKIVPTLNFENPSKGHEFNIIKENLNTNINTAISMNSAFGGNNACVIIQKA